MILSDDIRKLIFWLKVKETHTGVFPRSTDDLLMQLHKSHLFQRMMEGKQALPEPPPLKLSKPWYSLIENGIGYPDNVYKPDSFEADLFPNLIVIDQFGWNLLEEKGPEDWIVNYSFGVDGELVCADKWHVFKKDDNWIIKKVE